ncbi:hypothetical protein RTCIAT899_PC03475 (plasmid) [Rhizobium tropici CIAT 899]|nr:hypothetical protein RTCIAT899_PC03475 [Rhizobium tropici CIAT 899]
MKHLTRGVRSQIRQLILTIEVLIPPSCGGSDRHGLVELAGPVDK